MKFLLIFAFLASSFAATPYVYYVDIDSGPKTGGENSNGPYITIYGKNFGATRSTSTVTINGGAVATYTSWSDSAIVIEPGAAISTGLVVVTVGGVASVQPATAVNYTVRAGGIKFAVGSGTPPVGCSDANSDGTALKPWVVADAATSGTVHNLEYYQNNCLVAGDTLYLKDLALTVQSDPTGFKSIFVVRTYGTDGNPIAMVSYPGHPSSMTCGTGCRHVIALGSGTIANADLLTFAGLTFINNGVSGAGGEGGLLLEGNDRIVGNRFECPSCSSADAALEIGSASIPSTVTCQIYGNTFVNLSNSLASGSSKLFHAIYTHTGNCDIGWNAISATRAYNGIQVHYDGFIGAAGIHNISIHDNNIADVNGSCINLSTVSFLTGADYLNIYNNVLRHCGVAPANGGGAGDPHNCIAIKDMSTSASAGVIEIYNNSMYDCARDLDNTGAPTSSAAFIKGSTGVHETNVTVRLRNNIVQNPTYTNQGSQNTYFTSDSFTGDISGTNNIFFGGQGTIPVGLTSGLTSDPLYTSTTNLHIPTGSPAKNAGVTISSLVSDLDGNSRPQGASYDIGAYEFVIAASTGSTITGSTFKGSTVTKLFRRPIWQSSPQ